MEAMKQAHLVLVDVDKVQLVLLRISAANRLLRLHNYEDAALGLEEAGELLMAEIERNRRSDSMRKLLNWLSIFVLVLIVALVVVRPVLAQDSDYNPRDPFSDIPLPGDLLNVLGVALLTLLAPVAGSPLGSAITAFLKRFALMLPWPAVRDAPASTWNSASALLIVFSSALAGYWGLQNEWETVAKVILALAGVFGGVTLGAKSSHIWYNKVAQGVPYLGTSRTEDKARDRPAT